MRKILIMAAVLIVSGMEAVEVHAAIVGKCKACHHFTEKNKVGPGLKDVIGRAAGTHAGFKYQPDLGKGGWNWDEDHLRQWMCSSQDAIKAFSGKPNAKTRMPSQKICDQAKQDEVLAELRKISSH